MLAVDHDKQRAHLGGELKFACCDFFPALVSFVKNNCCHGCLSSSENAMTFSYRESGASQLIEVLRDEAVDPQAAVLYVLSKLTAFLLIVVNISMQPILARVNNYGGLQNR
ncbi:hypothetical protein [Noviherbaspirillum agri]